MTYRFHLIRPHSKCPDLTGWYLELRPDNPETLMKVHRGVVANYYFKFYNPIKLAAGWLQSVEHYLMAGETLLVNCNGGLLPLKDAIILETIESEDIDWDVRYDDEIITLSRWPAGKHWYLCSNKFRIFVPDKYVTYTAAFKAAQRYVPVKRIETKNA